MKQINNGYNKCYYLTKDGRLYNIDNDKYTLPTKEHIFKIKTEDNRTRKISLKTLYKIVYNENYCNDIIKDLEGEIWKEVSGTNKIYYVSNKGRIKSYYGYETKILKPTLTKGGYERIDIVVDKIRTSKLVSRVVAHEFLPFPKDIDYQLHHINGNKRDNSANNLIWLSPKEHIEIHRKKEERNS